MRLFHNNVYKTTSFYYQYDIKMCKKLENTKVKIWGKNDKMQKIFRILG